MTSTDSPAYEAQCNACGRGLPARAVFCSFCGAPRASRELDDENAELLIEPAAEVPSPETPTAPTESAAEGAEQADMGIEERLRVLKRLVEDDLITREDYEQRKARLLDSLTGEV